MSAAVVDFDPLRDKWRDRIAWGVRREGECWIWQGTLNEDGYGRTSFGRPLGQLAHRLSYLLFVGEIPAGATLDHLCRNRACVRPEHLEPVSLRENILRGEGVAARRARQTHCKRGHEFTPENTFVYSNRRRECVICRRDRRRRRYLETGR